MAPYGAFMDPGTLRYGRIVPGGYGETVEWRHWGCVTPAILTQLATITLEQIVGFQDLSPPDQQKIQLAISLRRIDPADIPQPAKTVATAEISTQVNKKKRKAEENEVPSTSRAILSTTEGLPPLVDHTNKIEDAEDALEDEVRDELYCTLPTSVVGIQYYKGLVGPGEEVFLVREPHNPYDSNAIQVKNIGQTQVGHLPRKVVLKLAPLLDRRLVTVEGVMNEGNLSGSGGYTLSITLRIYGASEMRDRLEPQLVWATPGQRGFTPKHSTASSRHAVDTHMSTDRAGPSLSARRSSSSVRTAAQQEIVRKQEATLQKAAELKQMLNNLEKVDDENRRSSLLDSLCSKDDIMNLPLHPNPPGIKNGNLNVDLLKHQSQALQWCIDREYPVLPKKESDKPIQLWQLRKTGNKSYYYNIATKTPQENAPLLGRGALCADGMGLGKTLTMLALILATKDDVPLDFSSSTLIVVPLSVLSNWEKQVEDHCREGSLSICVYYGNNRSMSLPQLAKFDIVLTTYQVVTGEHVNSNNDEPIKKKKKRGEKCLFEMQWKRIILDEGHAIRNPKTKMAKAVFDLRGQRRWVLTGTPIINSPRDLGSILTFLRICQPLDSEDFYKRLVLRPLKEGHPSGAELLRALMGHVCIRRTKEMQDDAGNSLISLPPVEMIIVPVTLDDEARALYDEVEQISKQRFQNYLNHGKNSMIQSNVLSMLTRMRQLALHPGLVPMNYVQELREMGTHVEGPIAVTVLSPEEKIHFQGRLAQAIEDFEECPICFGILNEPRITSCGHMFCLPCITEIISRDPKCPMDRRPLTMGDLLEPPPPTDLTQNPTRTNEEFCGTGIRGGSSAKIDQLVHLLKLTPPTEKSLVFSQFTSFLDKIAETLEAERIPYVRFDGQMSAKRRQQTIAQFSIPLEDGSIGEEVPISGGHPSISNSSVASENPKVMLLSLKAGAVGLNLTVANNVYLMDPWWQEGIESQAIDRVNRIGQNKPVHVYQLIAEKTVESKVMEIQERKKRLIQQAFSGIQRKEMQRPQREARLQDLIELFSIRSQTDY